MSTSRTISVLRLPRGPRKRIWRSAHLSDVSPLAPVWVVEDVQSGERHTGYAVSIHGSSRCVFSPDREPQSWVETTARVRIVSKKITGVT